MRKIVNEDLAENIWDQRHMDKIIPSLLYNIQIGDYKVTFRGCMVRYRYYRVRYMDYKVTFRDYMVGYRYYRVRYMDYKVTFCDYKVRYRYYRV